MDVKIRLVKPEELKKVSRVYSKVFTEFDVNEKWTEESAYRLLKTLYDRQKDLCFVAEVDESIVGGYFAAIKPWWDGNHLVDLELFVDIAYRNHGIGKKLCITMYREAIQKYHVCLVEGTTFKNKKFPFSWHKSIGLEESKALILIEGNPVKLLDNLIKK